MRSFPTTSENLRRVGDGSGEERTWLPFAMVVRRWAAGISPWLVAGALVPLAFALLVLRRPETLTLAEFWSDDGLFYQTALDAGPRSLVIPYAGTLSLLQRTIVLLETMVPATLAPVVGNAAALLVTALVAGFIVSPRMSGFVPSRAWRAAMAVGFVVLPATGWLYWTLADVQWLTGTFLVAMLVATPPTSARGRFGDAIGLLVAGLMGPLAILLLPLYVLRAVRAPIWRWHVLWLGIAAAVQLLVYLISFRMPAAGIDLAALPEVFALRAVVLPLAGSGPSAQAAIPIAIFLLVALAAAVWKLPRLLLAGAAFVVILIPLAGMQATQHPTASLVDPHKGEQYFYLCGVVFGALTIAALARGHRAAIPIALILLVGIVGDARISPVPPVGWAERAECIGGPEPCVVPVAPGLHWSVYWLQDTP